MLTRERHIALYLESVEPINIRSGTFEVSVGQSRAVAWKVLNVGERVAASILLTLMFPILLVATMIIVGISRRSPLVAHRRVGQGGRPVWILKLRTMWLTDSDKQAVLVYRLPPEAPLLPPAQKNAQVTSRFAAFCRRFSLDELPQLWHVVRGDMAFVGPRPLTRQELDTYYGRDVLTVLSRRPGITGLWQIKGRSRLTYSQRRRLDLFMVRKWSFSLYFKILLLTLPYVLAGTDAW